MGDRRRNLFILLLVFGLLAASLFVIATKPTKLGLDLRGGVELVYQGKPTPAQPTVTPEALERAVEIIRERVDNLGVSEPEIQRSGSDQISIGLPDVTNARRAEQQVGRVAQLYFYDWEKNVVGPDGKPDPLNTQVTGGQAAGSVGAIPLYDAVQRAAKRPAVQDRDNTTRSQFYLVDDKAKKVLRGPEESRGDLTTEAPAPKGSRVVEVKPGTVIVKAEAPRNQDGSQRKGNFNRYFVLDDDPALRGTQVTNPEQQFNQSQQPNVTFEFKNGGQEAWAKATRAIALRGAGQLQDALKRQHFAIVLDNEIISAPYIDPVDNPNGIDSPSSEISGGFTIQSAQDLANLLQTGALPIKLELISQSQVSATLGQQALDEGLLAGAVGLGVVILFLLAFYRLLGVIASAALIIYAIYFFALIKLIPITLTLPGIAGLILTIGVAADANIVIFERIKEEIRAGRSVAAGIAAGYKKGFATIVDANVVTFMTAFILFVLATSSVKGFAFTLGIGVIVSMLTAVLATQAALGTLGSAKFMRRPSALGAGPKRARFRFNFIGASKWFFSASGLILLICALAVGGKGIDLGIDFESGTRIKTPLERPATEDQVRAALAPLGFADAEVQRVDDPQLGRNVVQISAGELRPTQVQEVRQALDSEFGVGRGFSNTSVGPTFGQAVANSAIVAIIASLLVISAYIALRFEWKYAVPVLIALMHDLLITAGIYALVDREVTTATVAALLTVLGFSLYDTIIVFDRIRENVPRMPRAAFSQIVNRSMSEVLARSLATSFCAGLPVFALLLFGGETLQDFAFALLIGTLSGTYSSVFIASPVLNAWKSREPVYLRRAKRIKRENDGVVPSYAPQGRGADVEPEATKPPREPVTAPQTPEEISPEEFDDLVRNLGDGGGPAPAAPAAPAAAAPTPKPPSRTSSTGGASAPKRDKPAKEKRPRNRRHGRPR